MSKIFPLERHSKIIELINLHNTMEVKTLSNILDVTEATIRRDLAYLESQGLCFRTHGGAISIKSNFNYEFTPLGNRMEKNYQNKLLIAQYVANELVNNGDTLFIDGGSTTKITAMEMAKLHSGLTVITNAESIAIPLMQKESNNRTIITGGEFTEGLQAQVGPIAEKTINSMFAMKCIIGVSGIITNLGIFSTNPLEAEIKRLMISRSNYKIIIADDSKFGSSSLVMISDFSQIDVLVTNSSVNKAFIKEIEKQDVKVILV